MGLQMIMFIFLGILGLCSVGTIINIIVTHKAIKATNRLTMAYLNSVNIKEEK